MKQTLVYTIFILFITLFGLTLSAAHGALSVTEASQGPAVEKAVVVVSFGTTHRDALSSAIEPVEKEIAQRFKEFKFLRAFTSRIVRKRLAQKGFPVKSPEQALEFLASRGCQEVYIQPLHIIPGAEFHELVRTAGRFKNKFKTLKLGNPLLTEAEDFTAVARLLHERYAKGKTRRVVILMGHGTHHPANSCYAMLQAELSRLEPMMFVATVEGPLSLERLLPSLPEPRRFPLVLAPVMLVAGDHAKNDMAGAENDSWKQVLEKKGYRVTVVLKGIGEDPRFRSIFVKHLEAVMGHNHE